MSIFAELNEKLNSLKEKKQQFLDFYAMLLPLVKECAFELKKVLLTKIIIALLKSFEKEADFNDLLNLQNREFWGRR